MGGGEGKTPRRVQEEFLLCPASQLSPEQLLMKPRPFSASSLHLHLSRWEGGSSQRHPTLSLSPHHPVPIMSPSTGLLIVPQGHCGAEMGAMTSWERSGFIFPA